MKDFKNVKPLFFSKPNIIIFFIFEIFNINKISTMNLAENGLSPKR